MRGIKTILMIPAAAVLLLAGACTNNALDNSSGPDVILEVVGFTSPAVTAAINTSGFCSGITANACTTSLDCGGVEVCIIGGCTLTVLDWTVTLANVPKNSLAAGPGNDIAMIDVLITYGFPLGSNPLPRTVGLGGQVIETGGSGSINFIPIALQDLAIVPTSSTGSLMMDFRGQTLEGTTIHLIVGRDLSIEVCL